MGATEGEVEDIAESQLARVTMANSSRTTDPEDHEKGTHTPPL